MTCRSRPNAPPHIVNLIRTTAKRLGERASIRKPSIPTASRWRW